MHKRVSQPRSVSQRTCFIYALSFNLVALVAAAFLYSSLRHHPYSGRASHAEHRRVQEQEFFASPSLPLPLNASSERKPTSAASGLFIAASQAAAASATSKSKALNRTRSSAAGNTTANSATQPRNVEPGRSLPLSGGGLRGEASASLPSSALNRSDSGASDASAAGRTVSDTMDRHDVPPGELDLYGELRRYFEGIDAPSFPALSDALRHQERPTVSRLALPGPPAVPLPGHNLPDSAAAYAEFLHWLFPVEPTDTARLHTYPEAAAAAKAAASIPIRPHSWPPHDASHPGGHSCRVALGCVLGGPLESLVREVPSWLSYHRGVGVTWVYLGYDGSDRASLDFLRSLPGTSVLPLNTSLATAQERAFLGLYQATHRSEWNNRPGNFALMDRQSLLLTWALHEARRQGMDWLAHIDVDELFYSYGPSGRVDALLSSVSDHVASVRWMNHEGQLEAADVQDKFRQVTLFRVHRQFLPPPSAPFRALMVLGDSPTFLLLYANGKSAVRVNTPGVRPHGPHYFLGDPSPRWAPPATRAAQVLDSSRPGNASLALIAARGAGRLRGLLGGQAGNGSDSSSGSASASGSPRRRPPPPAPPPPPNVSHAFTVEVQREAAILHYPYAGLAEMVGKAARTRCPRALLSKAITRNDPAALSPCILIDFDRRAKVAVEIARAVAAQRRSRVSEQGSGSGNATRVGSVGSEADGGAGSGVADAAGYDSPLVGGLEGPAGEFFVSHLVLSENSTVRCPARRHEFCLLRDVERLKTLAIRAGILQRIRGPMEALARVDAMFEMFLELRGRARQQGEQR